MENEASSPSRRWTVGASAVGMRRDGSRDNDMVDIAESDINGATAAATATPSEVLTLLERQFHSNCVSQVQMLVQP